MDICSVTNVKDIMNFNPVKVQMISLMNVNVEINWNIGIV
jgi:hypothetical protein